MEEMTLEQRVYILEEMLRALAAEVRASKEIELDCEQYWVTNGPADYDLRDQVIIPIQEILKILIADLGYSVVPSDGNQEATIRRGQDD